MSSASSSVMGLQVNTISLISSESKICLDWLVIACRVVVSSSVEFMTAGYRSFRLGGNAKLNAENEPGTHHQHLAAHYSFILLLNKATTHLLSTRFHSAPGSSRGTESSPRRPEPTHRLIAPFGSLPPRPSFPFYRNG